MEKDRTLLLEYRRRVLALVMFSAVALAVVTIKSFNEGWFEPRTPLELNGRPALVFFTLGRSCECQMLVIRNAEAQLAAWKIPRQADLPVLRVDFSRRPDLAGQYGVARAPSLALLDAQGQVVWKQDEVLSDEVPLDLTAAEAYIRQMGMNSP